MVRAYVHICTAERCYNSRISHPNIGLFGFPRDPALCKTWLENCGRKDLTVEIVCKSNGYYKLCADHFEEKWFTDDTKTFLKRNINPIPTIFVNNVGGLFPRMSTISTKKIDLPPRTVAEFNDKENFHQCVLNPLELVVENKLPSVSYRNTPIIKHGEYDPDTISNALLNLRPETELYLITELCRFCMDKAAEDHVDMFSETTEAAELRNMCEFLMPKKLKMYDGLPSKVCSQCVSDLKLCHKIMKQFHNADCYLRAVAKYSLFIEDEDSFEKSDSEDESCKARGEFVKPISKTSMVIPLKNLKPLLEESQSYLADTSLPVNTSEEKQVTEKNEKKRKLEDNTLETDESVEIAPGSMVGAETLIADNQILQFCQSTDRNEKKRKLEDSTLKTDESVENAPGALVDNATLITDNQMLQSCEDDSDLICSNVVLIPSRDEDYMTSFFEENCKDETIEKGKKDVSTLNSQELGNNLNFIRSSECSQSNILQLFANKDIQSSNFSPEEYLDNSTNITLNNDNVVENSSYLMISYKCLECFEIFINYETLVEHVLSCHQTTKKKREKIKIKQSTNENPEVSNQYPEVNLDSASNIDFFENFNPNPSFKCGFCSLSFLSENELDKHVLRKHDTRKNCKYCDKEFRTPKIRRTHEETHTSDISTCEVCWVCGGVFKNKRTFLYHLESHEGKVYPCEVCKKELKSKIALLKHKRWHKPDHLWKKYVCNVCPKRFSSSQALEYHTNTHLIERPYKCEYCGKGFNRKDNLNIHEKRRINNNGSCTFNIALLKETSNIECDVCGRKFIKARNAKRHKKFHFCNGNPDVIQKLLDEPEVHKCEVCSRIFFSRMSLQLHMKSHTGAEKPFTCEFCDKSSASVANMVAHLRTHTGETPFTCKLCGMKFRTKGAITKHRNVHANDKTVCKTCNKVFPSEKEFLLHSLVHPEMNEEKPHQCMQCGRRFSRDKLLQRHIKNNHFKANKQAQKFPCSECGVVYSQKKTLRRHIVSKHPDKIGVEQIEVEPDNIDLSQFPLDYLSIIDSEEKNLRAVEVDGVTYLIPF